MSDVMPSTNAVQAAENGFKLQASSDASMDMPVLGGFKAVTDFAACVMPLLQALGWRGDPRHVAESLPHFAESLDLSGLRNVMANLRYSSDRLRCQLDQIDPRLLPCLFVPENKAAVVVIGSEDGIVSIFNGDTGTYEALTEDSSWKGRAYFFKKVDPEEMQSNQQKRGWFRSIADRFRPLVYQILGITFLLNLLALATPLFIMAVYDKVVATGSIPTLMYFGIGVGIALICDVVLRTIRTKIMAYVGARFDNLIGNAVFERILFLPPALTERATIGAQVSRIKDFESVRDFFTGPMALVLFELPFVFIFITVIAVLGGPVAFVPIVMVVLFIILSVVVTPLIKNSVSRAARATSKRQEFLVEALSNMRAVRYTNSEERWYERYREMSADASYNNFITSQYNSLIMTTSHVLMVAAGLSTIAFGVYRVLDGEMTTGGLVASMILVWRVLAPLQTGFMTITRLEQVKASVNQLDNLMNIKAERDFYSKVTPLRNIRGRVTFSRVSLRYRTDTDPALIGVSFDANPGEVVIVLGGNGAGKSTVLKLVNGMYHPQGGNVRIDNMDIRQMDPVELRHTVAYVPQQAQFFYGTIAQNMRLAKPTATDEDLRWAAEQAAVLEDIEAMTSGDGKWARHGFEARLSDNMEQLPTSFVQRLNLARAYLKRAPVYLFDEPGNGLDFEGDKAFMKTVESMKGHSTVLIVTHRPSHIQLADKIVWLENGHLRMSGPAEEVKKHLPRNFL